MTTGTTAGVAPKLGFVFPGQGSQSVGMLADLRAHRSLIEETFAEASQRLSIDLWALAQEGPLETLNKTANTQPALLAGGVAGWRVWRSEGGPLPAYAAGHSLGEYTALVASEVLSLSDAAWLVAQRGRLMQRAVPLGEGAMAAILGLDNDTVSAVCAEAAADELVQPANFNADGQVVVAGHTPAVDRAVALAREAGARHAMKLVVSVPSHCALMEPVAREFAQYFEQVNWAEPRFAVIHNTDVSCYRDPEKIREVLIHQLERPVRWLETIQRMRAEGIEMVIESGPGKILSRMIQRIDRALQCRPLLNDDGLQAALTMVAE